MEWGNRNYDLIHSFWKDASLVSGSSLALSISENIGIFVENIGIFNEMYIAIELPHTITS